MSKHNLHGLQTDLSFRQEHLADSAREIAALEIAYRSVTDATSSCTADCDLVMEDSLSEYQQQYPRLTDLARTIIAEISSD